MKRRGFLYMLGHSMFVEQGYLADANMRERVFGFGFGFMSGSLISRHHFVFFGLGFLIILFALLAATYHAPVE